MLKSSTSRVRSLRTSYSLGLSFILALVFVSMLFAQQAYATAQATVAWNADTGQVAGYDVYYGSSSGKYTTTLNAGNTTSATLTNLSAQTYYIAVTAYNSSNTQSGYSPELVVDSLTASAGSGGTISPSGTFFQTQGASQTFTVTPSAGYTTASVLVDGTSVGAVSSYTFSNIAANHTISATFTAGATSYTITPSAGANGTISPSGAVTVNSGGSQTFSFTPATGYQVSSVVVDGTTVTTASSYTFSNVTGSHTISVTFAPTVNTYTITASAGANGTISPSGAVTVNSGGSQTFSFSPATGYKVSNIVVDNATVTTASSYTFSNVTGSHTISVTFAPITYTITASAGSNGTISPSSAVTVNSGGSQTFSFTPATGYQVSSIAVDGTTVTTASSYSFSNVTANHTISVSFAPTTKTYTITPSAGANGTISPSGAVTVNSGGSQTFSFTPATGCQVSSVLIDGGSVGALTSYTFSNVTANHTISATFASSGTFTITPTAGTNGTISPATLVTVKSGASQSFTIAPATGCKVANVEVDGATVGALTSYTFSNVKANHTISASFGTANQPPVANAGPDQTVARGAKVTLNGSNSTDVNGPGIASYLWTQVGGTRVRLTHPSAAVTTFNAPTRIGALTFQLTVKDANGVQSSDTCIVNVASAKQAATVATANAGPDQTVNEGTSIALDASKSKDNEETTVTLSGSNSNGALSYLWEQIDGPAVTLSNPTSPQPAFAVPQVASGAASLKFRLTVTNKYGLKSTDTCFVNVTLAGAGPQAVAGPTKTALAGSVVTLEGASSTAPGGGIDSYIWHQTQGSPVTLSAPTSVTPAFTAVKAGAGHYGNQLTFMLIVKGADGMRTRTTQVIEVEKNTSERSGLR